MKRLKLQMLLFAMLLSLFFFSCQKEETSTKLSRAEEINQAKEWYNEELACLDVSTEDSDTLSEKSLMSQLEPDWKLSFRRGNDVYRTVEANMSGDKNIFMVSQENLIKFEQTQDSRYKQSMTRLVIRTNRKTNKKVGFLMTIVPSVSYIEGTNFEPFHITYLNRDENYSGYIIYHDLNGNFIVGRKYEEGEIVSTLKSSDSQDESLNNLKSASSCYDWVEYEIEVTYCGKSTESNEFATYWHCWNETSIVHVWEEVTCLTDDLEEDPYCEDCRSVDDDAPVTYQDNYISAIYKQTTSTLTDVQYANLRRAYDNAKEDADMNVGDLTEALEAAADYYPVQITFKIDASIDSYISLDESTQTVKFKDSDVINTYYPYMGQIIEFMYDLNF